MYALVHLRPRAQTSFYALCELKPKSLQVAGIRSLRIQASTKRCQGFQTSLAIRRFVRVFQVGRVQSHRREDTLRAPWGLVAHC